EAQIGSSDPTDRMYADALGGVLAYELLRLHGTTASRRTSCGGLATWQQKRVLDFMEEHLAEDFSLSVLADLVRLSPYHFVRSFKRSSGNHHIDTGWGPRTNPPRPCSQIPTEPLTKMPLMSDLVDRTPSTARFAGFQD